MSIHEMLIPTYRNMLRAASGMIDKASGHAEGDTMLEARLAEDMFPLAHQFRMVANMPGEALARLAGVDFSSRDQNPSTFAETKAWMSETLALIEKVAPGDFMAEDEEFDMALPNGMTFHLSALVYARDWALPNFYFHTSIAYAIMRMNGVALGKGDLIPHMGRYLQQPD